MTNSVTLKAQHILSPAAKKRIFWQNYKQQLQLHFNTKRPTNMITFKAQHILNPAAQNGHFGEILIHNYSCK